MAIPWIAATVSVPDSVPAPGFAASATVTASVAAVTVFPKASCTATWTAGVIGCAPAAALGCTTTASVVFAPGAIANGTLVAPVSAPELATSV